MKRTCLCAALLGIGLLVGSLYLIAGPTAVAKGKYLGPDAVVAASDGSRLYVAQRDARQIAVVETASGKVVGSVSVPAEPTGLVLNKDSTKLYVTCAAPQSVVCVIETPALKIARTLPAGHTAFGAALSPDGKRLYVCNCFNNNVSVLDLITGKEIKIGRAHV